MANSKYVPKYLFIAFFVIIAYLAFRITLPFFNGIVIGALVAYIVYPGYKKLNSYTRRKTLSAAIMTVIVLLLIFIPLSFSAVKIGNDMLELYNTISVSGSPMALEEYFGESASYLVPLNTEKARSYIFSIALRLIKSVPFIAVNLLVALFVLFFSLRDGKSLMNKIKAFIPVSPENRERIILKLKRTIDSVLYVSIMIAIIQGILSAIIFSIFGLKASLLWALMLMVASILPLIGPTTIWVPICIYLFIKGDVFAAAGIAIFCFIFVSLIFDYILKPKLIAKKGRLHPLIALFGILGGIPIFGITGIIIGPFVLSLFIFLFQVYTGVKK
ncbi:MAG: AI-2E family transporter [Candidatus Woesearchaeota archaeon]